MKQIFPKEIIDNTIHIHQFKHQVKSKIIYTVLLLMIISSLISLPFIWLDIYTNSRGILRPEKERNQILSLYSGRVDTIFIKQNQFVNKDDTLLIINNSIGKERLKLIKIKKGDNIDFAYDLEYLLKNTKVNVNSLKTLKYKKEYLQFKQNLRNLKTKYNKTKRDFRRQTKLYKKGVIARVEYENTKYIFDLAVNELNNFKKQQKTKWQSELTQYKIEIKDLDSNLKQEEEQNQNYIITAPITGTVQNLIGLEPGSFLTAGKIIAEISPKTNLIAECYVSPQDIGLLRIENPVKFQIDAFNYNQWGMATGKITDISKDVMIIENRPMFRVICKLDQKELSLKNGFKGELKKGMTFNARFFIIKRTAFNLLYDKVDDWFNPSNTLK